MQVKIFVYILFIFIESFIISFLEETYKKVIRKDNFKPWECRVLGLVLSAGALAILIFSHLFYPIFNTLFNASLWLDHLFYFSLFYFLQLKSDTLVLKKLIRSFVNQWLQSNIGISIEELQGITKNQNK